MKYRYPKISNALTYQRIDDNSFEVVDHLTDNSFTFGINVVRYVRKLDGFTHPYKIPSALSKEEIHDIIKFLDEYDLVRHSDTMRVSFGTTLKTLWIPRRTLFLRLFAYVSNALLILSWLPVLIIGIAMFVNNIDAIEFEWLWAGYFIGLFCGMLFHELGHAFAGISYGARVFEMGVMVMYCIIPGAYVLLDRTPVKKRLQRIQINAAGVEMNFMLCGTFLVLGACFPSLGGMFLNAAICNGFIGALNLTFIKGLDGTAIVSDLLGVDNVIDRARKVVFSRKERRKIMCQGSGGYATVTMCYMLFVLQIALPVLLVTNILEVVSCFV